MTRLKKSVVRAILNNYFDLSFPASYQSVRKFHKAIQKKLKIKISERSLRKILKNNAWFQVNVTRPKKFLMRRFYSRGSGLLAFADPCYIQLPNRKIFKFLVVADSCSKFVFATVLSQVNPKELKKAFTRLFKHQQMSYYPIITVDRDRSLGTLARPYFSSRKMLLKQKRGKSHLIYLEPIIKTIKKKIIQNIRKQRQRKTYSDKLLKRYLKEAVESYNGTINNAHKITPREAHNIELDPWHRKVQFPHEQLEPFDRWFTDEMRRQKKANTPNKKARENFNEKVFRLGDHVFIDWDQNAVGMYNLIDRDSKVLKQCINMFILF